MTILEGKAYVADMPLVQWYSNSENVSLIKIAGILDKDKEKEPANLFTVSPFPQENHFLGVIV